MSSVRTTAWERAPCRRYGPTKACTAPSTREGCRHPANQGAFHRCDRAREWIAPPRLPASVPRSRRPHLLPMAGDNVLWRTLQASPPALPGGDIRGAGHLFNHSGTHVGSCEPPPGTDDPSEPTWLGLRGLSRELIATAVPTPTAAPLRLLRPRARGSMRRELHEPFMPDGSRTRNKEEPVSITFILHSVIHSRARRVTARNHEGPSFQAPIAADYAGWPPCLWRTMSTE